MLVAVYFGGDRLAQCVFLQRLGGSVEGEEYNQNEEEG